MNSYPTKKYYQQDNFKRKIPKSFSLLQFPSSQNSQQLYSQRPKYEQLEQLVQLKEENVKILTKQLQDLKTKNHQSQKFYDEEIDSYKEKVFQIQNELKMQEINDENEIKELQNLLNKLELEHIEQQQQLEEKNQKLQELKIQCTNINNIQQNNTMKFKR